MSSEKFVKPDHVALGGITTGPMASNIQKPATLPPAPSPSANTPSNNGGSNNNSGNTNSNTPRK